LRLANPSPEESGFREFDRRTAAQSSKISVTSFPRTGDMAQLVEKLPYNGDFRHVRDTRYLDWRYKNPLRQYRFLYLDSGTLDGYLVLQSTDPDRIDIVDWEASSHEDRGKLMNTLLQLTRSKKIQIWLSTLPAAARDNLRQAGFVPVGPGKGVGRNVPGILTVPLSDGGEKQMHELGLDDVKNWDLRMLYSMHG
jgi:hypothetical protein